MICSLYIKNVALIEESTIQFDKKLNILSGETGSGKSVILDSINFVLGSKADKSMIRYGADYSLVRAEFYIGDNPQVKEELNAQDIDCDDDNLIVSRKLTSDGRGSIKVNGITVTAGMLKRIAGRLVDVHGQSEHFFLLSENNQLSVIDSLCREKLTPLEADLSTLIAQKRECQNKIKELGGSESERVQRLDILSYQITEIERAEVKVGEIEQLKARKKILDNAEKVINALNCIKGTLSDDNCCLDLLSSAKRQAQSISDLDDVYAHISERLENLFIEAEDIDNTLSDLANNFTFDSDEAERIEERLSLYKNLIKKYGSDEGEILKYLSEAKTKFDALTDAAEALVKLNEAIKKLNKKIFSVCRNMTSVRKEAAEGFCSAVIEELKILNIPNANFYVDFMPYDEDSPISGSDGADKICFMFSANKGEPPKPLSKVISGGEMSRFMLAIKTRLKGINGITTYIFDEIDAGISGVTAKSVADKFVSISEDTQIIAVSHLPQVCASASSQFLISKSDMGNKTVTSVKLLTRNERVEEIVRLTGSLHSSAATQHADELLKQFGN